MADIFIYGDIGQPQRDKPRISASAFLSQLSKIPAAERLNVRIHSNGGSVSEAAAIFNAIKSHPGGADTQIDGIAASAAAYIAMAGERIRMAGNAMLMIHKASVTVQGTAADLRREADVVDQFNATLFPAFASRTGKTVEELSELMSADHYMTATQAKALGFVDEITGDLKLAASLTLQLDGSAFDKPEESMSDPISISAEDKTFIQNLREFFVGKAVVDPVAQLTADLTTVRASLAQTTLEKESVVAKLSEVEAKLAEAEAKIETPEAIAAKIDKEVTARIAASGTNPIKRDPKAAESEVMNRAAFEQLPAAEQSAFCRKGGKITD